MTARVFELPAADTFSVEQALASAKRANLQDVLIIGYAQKNGHFVLRNSAMLRTSALWLLEMARLEVLKVPSL